MPRFAANLTMLFTERPLLDRVAAAAEAGFQAVEVQYPYDVPAQDLRDRLLWAGLPLILFSGPPPNYTGGQPGFAAIPGGQDRFRRDFARTLRYARVLGPHHLHLMSGPAEGEMAKQTLIGNLRWAAAQAPKQRLTIEPANRFDLPGYFLSDYDLALEVIGAVAAPNLGLQFDAYHAHRITGDVPGTWDRVRAHVSHVQIAGHPGRHEPVGGDIDYPAFFALLDADGYDGWVSAEYHPEGQTTDGLGWLAASC